MVVHCEQRKVTKPIFPEKSLAQNESFGCFLDQYAFVLAAIAYYDQQSTCKATVMPSVHQIRRINVQE